MHMAKDTRDDLAPRAPVGGRMNEPQAFDIREQSFDSLVGLGQKFAQGLIVHRARL
jgi:hypothetical protein